MNVRTTLTTQVVKMSEIPAIAMVPGFLLASDQGLMFSTYGVAGALRV